MKEDINIKEEIITDELNYNNLMEFQTDINRNTLSKVGRIRSVESLIKN